MKIYSFTVQIVVLLLLFSMSSGFFSTEGVADSTSNGELDSNAADSLLQRGRAVYYIALEDEDSLATALAIFDKLGREFPEIEGRARTYTGSLLAVRGRYAFWPKKKLSFTNEGLEVMEEGVQQAGEDVEALFIHGSTLWYLPFFFKKGDEARESFSEVIRLLPDQAEELDPDLLANVIDFLENEFKPSDEEMVILMNIRNEYLDEEPTDESEPESDN